MNPVLWNRDIIGELSTPLQEDLDQLVANIGTGWAVEHDDQGHHTTVTAQSVLATQIGIRNSFATLDFRGGNGQGGEPLYLPKGVMFVSLMCPPANLLVLGIQQGRLGDQQPGDFLFLRADPASVGYLILQYGASQPPIIDQPIPTGCQVVVPSKLAWPGLPPPPNQFRMSAAENTWVHLVYSPNMVAGNIGAWSLFHGLTD